MSLNDINLQSGPSSLNADAETVTIHQVVFNVTFDSAAASERFGAGNHGGPQGPEATIPAELEELSEDLKEMAVYLQGLVSFLRHQPSAVPPATWDYCPSQPS